LPKEKDLLFAGGEKTYCNFANSALASLRIQGGSSLRFALEAG